MNSEGVRWEFIGLSKPAALIPYASGARSQTTGRFVKRSDVMESDLAGLITKGFFSFGEGAAMEMLEATLQKLVAAAQALCPVRTGMLKGSITYFIVPEFKMGGFGSDTPYARWVNDGTSTMTGFHFLEGALDSVRLGG